MYPQADDIFDLDRGLLLMERFSLALGNVMCIVVPIVMGGTLQKKTYMITIEKKKNTK